MTDTPDKNLERLEQTHREKPSEEKKETEAIREVVEGTEIAEFIEGEVSEEIGEGKRKVAGGMPGAKTGSRAEAVAKRITYPKVDVMRIQIATQINKEIVRLEKEASKILRNPGKFEPFHLNLLVARIRSFKDILANLAHSTTETLKHLWKRFVKGISS